MSKRALIAIIIVFCVFFTVQSVTGWTVQNYMQSPSGNTLNENEQITITFKLDIGTDFSQANNLGLQTELSSPIWGVTYYKGDIAGQTEGASAAAMYLYGWLLSEPKDPVYVLVTLTGKTPSSSTSKNNTFVAVKEYNENGQVTNTYTKSVLVTSGSEFSSVLSSRKADLASFRLNIDEKAAIDVDVSEAENKYSSAKLLIDSANSASPAQYPTALNNLKEAQQQITDGGVLLDKAWAQKTISDAQQPITLTDGLINYFKVNRSMGSDPRLTPIISTRETAAQYLSSANDFFTQANYAQARVKANEAFDKANQSYTDALALKREVGDAFNPVEMVTKPLGSNWKYILIGIGIVIVIIGILYWRGRSRWDELG